MRSTNHRGIMRLAFLCNITSIGNVDKLHIHRVKVYTRIYEEQRKGVSYPNPNPNNGSLLGADRKPGIPGP